MWGGSRTVAGMTAIPFGARQAGRHLARRSRRPEIERADRSLRLAARAETRQERKFGPSLKADVNPAERIERQTSVASGHLWRRQSA